MGYPSIPSLRYFPSFSDFASDTPVRECLWDSVGCAGTACFSLIAIWEYRGIWRIIQIGFGQLDLLGCPGHPGWQSGDQWLSVQEPRNFGPRCAWEVIAIGPFYSVGIDHIQHTEYIICCCMLGSCASMICRPGLSCEFNNFLKRQCCLHFLFLCILHHCHCTTWSWSRVLVSLALQRSPTGFQSHLSVSNHIV